MASDEKNCDETNNKKCFAPNESVVRTSSERRDFVIRSISYWVVDSIHYSLLTVHYSRSIIQYSLFPIHSSPFITSCPATPHSSTNSTTLFCLLLSNAASIIRITFKPSSALTGATPLFLIASNTSLKYCI